MQFISLSTGHCISVTADSADIPNPWQSLNFVTVFIVPMFVFTQMLKCTHPYQPFPSEEVTVTNHLLNFDFIGTSSMYNFMRMAEDLSLSPNMNELQLSGTTSGCICTGPDVMGL